jgi:hypothetical protein
MVISKLKPLDDALRVEPSPAHAVSWGAVFAGATGAAALSLILLILGTGLGLSSASPWAQAGASAATLGVATIAWILVTQLLASGMGGYLAGRLRTKWVDVHTDEVFFRDTAHGFLAWAVASLATAALLTSVIGTIVGGGVQVGAKLAGQAAATTAVSSAVAAADTAPDEGTAQPTGGPSTSVDYFVDTLFRKNMTAAPTVPVDPAGHASLAEVVRIFVNGLRAGALPQDDVRYVGTVVAQRTGLSQKEAEKRVADTFTSAQTKLRDTQAAAKAAADKARKASAYTALWLFISLLVGAFIASYAATFGGRLRDA